MQKELSTGKNSLQEAWCLESGSSKKLYFYCCKHPGCNYKTTRSGHMKRHERTHTKEKPYKCTMCSYTASRSDHLRRHMKIHSKTICALTSSPAELRPIAFHSATSSPTVSSSPILSVAPSPVDYRPLSFDSATTSPVASPSPVLSASSSPTLAPFAPTVQSLPSNYLGTRAKDEDGMWSNYP